MKKILVIDDDENIQTVLNHLLTKKGFEVCRMPSGSLPFDFIRREMPDIVLLDIWMGKFNGLDICRAIKMNPLTSDIKVLLMSGVDYAYQLGDEPVMPDGYIAKPFDIRHLMIKIDPLAA